MEGERATQNLLHVPIFSTEKMIQVYSVYSYLGANVNT